MQNQDHCVRVKRVESFWIILRIMTIKDNEKRDIHSTTLASRITEIIQSKDSVHRLTNEDPTYKICFNFRRTVA